MSSIDSTIYANVNLPCSVADWFAFLGFFCFLYHIAVYTVYTLSTFVCVHSDQLLLNMLSFQLPGNMVSVVLPLLHPFISFHQPEGAALPPCFSMCVCVCA